MTNSFDIESTRRDLIAMRLKHGADSPIGMRCSNIIEQLQNYAGSGRADQRVWLLRAIAEQRADLERIVALNADEGKSP